MHSVSLPARAAIETAIAHGITPDRCEVLQDASTLVLRLTEDLVARVVQDRDGPRQGTEWFSRENAIAAHLTEHAAPVIPLHAGLPAGPHEHLGYPLNFWQYVHRTETAPQPREIGLTLQQCHSVMRSFPQPLPRLAIITESHSLLESLYAKGLLPKRTIDLLDRHLQMSLETLGKAPRQQPLHGDAHMGNLMNTTRGLLWTDWEDTFTGPVEWDVASVIWNAQILEADEETTRQITQAYRDSGGILDDELIRHCLIARAAVVTAWYPILYPRPNEDRQDKMRRRIAWLETVAW